MKFYSFLTCLAAVSSLSAQEVSLSDPQVLAEGVVSPWEIQSGDLDGDGDEDLVYYDEGGWTLKMRFNNGNAQFGEAIWIGELRNGRALDLGDLDGDGDLDVLASTSSSFGPRQLLWFRNDGAGGFGSSQVIFNPGGRIDAAVVADLNGDQLPDVVVANSAIGELIWFENLGDRFGAGTLINTGQSDIFSSFRTLVVGDLDRDGNVDLVMSSPSPDRVFWVRSLGNGQFAPGGLISDQVDDVSDLALADLDGDDFLDVISASFGTTSLSWHRNRGDGSFEPERVISRSFESLSGARPFDLDGDGDLDVIANGGGLLPTSTRASWFENDGQGNFGIQQILIQGQGGIRSMIPVDVDGDVDLDLLYLDQEERLIGWIENLRPAVPVVEFFRSDRERIQPGDQVTLEWEVNNFDSITIEPGSLSPDGSSIVVTPNQTTTYRLEARNSAGVNSRELTVRVDGPPVIDFFRPDPLTVQPGSSFALTWDIEDATTIEIDQGVGVVTGNRVTVSSLNREVTLIERGAVWSYLDDGSNLGGQDWTSSGFNDRVWKSGPAKLGYGERDEATVVDFGSSLLNRHITTYFRKSFEVSDPGRLSSLLVSVLRDDGAVIYLNGELVARSNMPADFDARTLALSNVSGAAESTYFDLPIDAGLLREGTNVIAVEIHQVTSGSSDLAFDLELTAQDNSSRGTYTLTATNQYGSTTARTTVQFRPPLFDGQTITINTTESDTAALEVADFDGDGLGDVLVGILEFSVLDGLMWFRNNGDTTFSPRRDIADLVGGRGVWVGTADINGDGISDALTFSRQRLAWYPNLGGGSFGSGITLSSLGETRGDYLAVTGDFDGDGDVDVANVVTLDDDTESIQWFQNNGSGGFQGPQIIFSGGKDIESISSADLNGDGIDDIAFVDSVDNKASWLPAGPEGNFGEEQRISTNLERADRVALADLNGDGQTDLITVSFQPRELTVFLNDGLGAFFRQSMISYDGQIFAIKTGDLDLDGDLDLVYTDFAEAEIVFLENDGTGLFAEGQVISVGGNNPNIRALDLADLDGDQDLEVVFGSRRRRTVEYLDNQLDPAPIIRSFTAGKNEDGDRAILEWSIAAASEVRINPGIGLVTGNSISVPLTETTTFEIIAENTRGQVKEEVTVVLDLDGDGLPDDWEQENFGNLDQGAEDDPDQDQLNNAEELAIRTNPTEGDSDGDDLDDFEEATVSGTDPLDPDSDADGFRDGEEVEANANPLDSFDFPATALVEGLIFYAPLDDQILDEIGGIVGIADGETIGLSANGQMGGALEFDEPATAAHQIEFNPTTAPDGSWSASFWFKPDGPLQDGTIVAANWRGDSFEARLVAGRLQLFSWREGAEQALQGGDLLGPDQWHHVGLGRVGNGDLKAVLNGVPGGFSPITPLPYQEADETLLLLGSDVSGGNPFEGFLDDVAIWNRGLGDQDFLQIAGNGRAGNSLTGINDRVAGPQVTLQPRGGAFLVGESTTLTVEFEGTVPIDIQWLRDGVEIAGANSRTLSLDPLAVEDSGLYSAMVTNLAGSTRSVEVLISVANDTPRATGQLEIPSTGPIYPGDEVLIEGDYLFIGSASDNGRNGVVHVFLRDASVASGWREVQEIPSPRAGPITSRENFGVALAAHGDTLVVGTGSPNIAYVFELSGPENWTLVQTIVHPSLSGIRFADALDLDERTLVIGARQANDRGANSGAVFVYERNADSGQWEEVEVLTAGDEQDNLGSKVAVDGDTIIAAAIGIDTPPGGNSSGGAYIFQRTSEEPGSSWRVARRLQPESGGLVAQARFGWSVDIDRDTAVVGAPFVNFGLERSGAVFVFDRNAGGPDRWNQTGRILHRGRQFNDFFGTDVQLRGNRLYASFVNDSLTNSRNGGVFIYDRDGPGDGTWDFFAEFNESPRNRRREFGNVIAVTGTEMVIGARRESNLSPSTFSRFYLYDIPPGDNSAPVFGDGPPGSAVPREPFSFEISVSDPEGQPVRIGAAVLPAWLRVIDRGDGTALLTGVPSSEDFGEHPVEILASDGLINGSRVLAFTIEVVNTPPIVEGFEVVEVDEDSPAVTLDLLSGFSDAEYPDSELVFEIIGEISDLLSESTSINPTTGELDIGFVSNANGETELVIRATDPGGLSADATVSVIITPVNDAPVSTTIGPLTADDRASAERIQMGALFSDVDVDDVLTFSLVGNTGPGIFSSLTLDPQTGELHAVFADYVDGESTLTVRATDTGGLFADSELIVTLPPIPKPRIVPDTGFRLNPRTGLYEQQITVTNESGRAMAGFDLTVSNLNEGVSVSNRSGSLDTGGDLVTHLSIISPGQSVTTRLEYYSATRSAPGNPDFEASPILPRPDQVPPGRVFEIDRIEMVPEGVVIEFPSEVGRTYAVQYSADGSTWVTSPTVLRAGGNRIQWIDSGLPKTSSPPSVEARRFYRIIELSDASGPSGP